MQKYEEILKNNNQEHIFKYLDMANDEQKQQIINQIENIDFEQLNQLYDITLESKGGKLKSCIIEHTDFVDKYNIKQDYYQKLEDIGKEIIKNNKYAVVTMAGGQGTRLGFDGPKGTFKLNIAPKPKYLFEIIADGIKEANDSYGITLPWYIMTSNENNKQTVDFFKQHNYFNYPQDHIMFFIQGDLPLVDEKGKLLVDEKFNIKLAADGNGCIFKAMKNTGVLSDMKNRGIEWVFIGAVDNALLKMTDPILLGLTIDEKNQIGSKSIVKRNPQERVGVFCKKDNLPSVIEYTELPEQMAEERDEEGDLLFGESHIMCNLFSIDALEKISSNELPYHFAHKKASFLNEDGKLIKPEEPNAYKYEAFIFDGFNYFDDISILRGCREKDFAPIKNKEGSDSPETAIKLYNDYWKEV